MDDSILLSTDYILVIDTDYYAYDFANQLTAYCTGITDEEEVGAECADLFYADMQIQDDTSPRGRIAEEKNQFFEYVVQRLQDEYCSPCAVWLNKKYGCNEDGTCAVLTQENYDQYASPAPFSVGIFFGIEPTPELVQIIKDRSLKFFREIYQNERVNVEGFRLIVHTRYGKEVSL